MIIKKYCNSNSNCKVAKCVIIDEAGIFNCTSLGFIYGWLCSPQASNNNNDNNKKMEIICYILPVRNKQHQNSLHKQYSEEEQNHLLI